MDVFTGIYAKCLGKYTCPHPQSREKKGSGKMQAPTWMRIEGGIPDNLLCHRLMDFTKPHICVLV